MTAQTIKINDVDLTVTQMPVGAVKTVDGEDVIEIILSMTTGRGVMQASVYGETGLMTDEQLVQAILGLADDAACGLMSPVDFRILIGGSREGYAYCQSVAERFAAAEINVGALLPRELVAA